MPLVADIHPTPGEIVRVRSRKYLVEGVTPALNPGDQTLVRLSCLEDDAEGEELEVLWEKEVDAERIDTADWSKLASGQFDDPKQFGSYYHTLRWNSVTSIRNELELELVIDEAHYRLVEKTTGSTIRVISQHLLLRNAFATFYSGPDA